MNSVYGKMVKVMKEIGGVEKNGKHQQGYMYASAEDVANAVRAALVEVNLAFFPAIESVAIENGRYQVKYNYTFADPDTGDTLTLPWQGEALVEMATKNGIYQDDKALGKCHTYAEKYFFMRTFVASAGDDPDADTNDPQARHKSPANPHPRLELATKPTRERLAKAIVQYYGKESAEEVRKSLVSQATEGLSTNSADMSEKDAVTLCEEIEKQIADELATPPAKSSIIPDSMGADDGIPNLIKDDLVEVATVVE